MPRIRDYHVNGQSRSLSGTDRVAIGSARPTGQVVTAATMADAARIVKEVRFLVKQWVPFGMITGVIAEPGMGKSAFVLYALARPVLTGCGWFTGMSGPEEPGHVLWCATENDLAITVDRAKRWGIPMNGILMPFEDPLASLNLMDDEHVARIEELVNQYRPPLVIVDSLRGSHDGDENNSRVGRILQSLAAVAERTRTAMVVVHHTRKLMVDEEISANSSRGSNAILAMMRSQLGVDRPDVASKWCRLRVLKENLGIAPQPVGYNVTDAGLVFGQAPERSSRTTQKAGAIAWLRARLTAGWHCAAEVLADADQFGFSTNSVQRAREDLGITLGTGLCRKRTDGKYEWRLP